MSTVANPYEIPRPVARKVSRLRLLVRLYSLAEGLAAVAIVAGLAFWLGLAVDWLFEPSRHIRIVIEVLVAAAALFAAWRYIGRRVLAPLPADSLALLVERQYPDLDESLVTTIQASRYNDPYSPDLARSGLFESGASRELMDATSRRAAESVEQVRLRRVFNMRPLLRKGATATALLAAIAAFALIEQDAYRFWTQRMRLSDELWPRRVALTVVGFEDRDASRVVNVARGDNYDVTVLASLLDGHVAPEEVEVRWRQPAVGSRGGGPMLKIGEAAPGRDDAQQYKYTFNVTSDVEFDVRGGDDRVRNLRLHAVERPAVTRVWLEVEYPAYMQREARSIPISGRAELPEGAKAVCRVESNKPLESVTTRDALEKADVPTQIAGDNPKQLSFPIGAVTADRAFLITMHDADGVENRDPFRLAVAVIPDQPPEVSVQLRGIGTAVTPQATIPLAGKVTDDNGLHEAWFEYQVNENAAEHRPLAASPEGLTELPMTDRFDLAATDPETKRPRVALQPGQKFSLAVKARDAYDLTPQAHVGSSQRFLLDVVTPSELRALLEKRELGLRQRFEAIHEKMQSTRDLLDRIDLAAAAKAADDKSGEAAAAAGDQSIGSTRVHERDRSRLTGARQSATQLAFETSGVAEGFDDIVAELINNRVDTEELKERLEQGIAEPLKSISGELLPRLEQRLDAVQTAYDANAAGAAEPLAAAKAEADGVLKAMQAVLDRMLELESYNELVELLRGIVNDQQQLKEKTKQQQREKLRVLIEP